MSKQIGFAFDLHGTLVLSNEAWLEAYVSGAGEGISREEIEERIYRKTSRKQIAEKCGVPYEDILERYHRLVQPDEEMCRLARELSAHYPVFLVSSANPEKVARDLGKIAMDDVFTAVYHQGNFCKEDRQCWEKLTADHHLDLLFYIGNDFEEDVSLSDKVCVLLSGRFMSNLNRLGLLFRRGGGKI